MRAGRRAQAFLLVLGDMILAGRAFDEAGLDSGLADAFGQFGDVNVGYFVDRALLEIGACCRGPLCRVRSRR